MNTRTDQHLTRLSSANALRTLTALELPWTPLDQAAAGALRFKRTPIRAATVRERETRGDVPTVVGLIGGASSGKSTLFNSLIEREVSRVGPHAHETLGPIAAAHTDRLDRVAAWIDEQTLFSGFTSSSQNGQSPTTGKVDRVQLCPHDVPDCADLILVDLPDVTSKLSDDEGSVTRNLLPWLDGLIVVVDEERWFDGAVFDDTVEFARNLGPRIWVVFNRTERGHQLTNDQRAKLAQLAATRRACAYCVSPFTPGVGYRPLSKETRGEIVSWISNTDASDRATDLDAFLRRRCADLLRENVARSDQMSKLRRAIDNEIASLAEETRLTTDLLTDDERRFLGLGHRFVPLYGMIDGLRRALPRLGWGSPKKTPADSSVDFDKSVDALAAVLRRNLQHRFRHATDVIDRLILDSPYTASGPSAWQPSWKTPQLDAADWATRIRAAVDAWTAEAAQQSRRGDWTAMALGTPLLLADLLFLGGAGVTLTWATAWVAGFLGGKSLSSALHKSQAFEDYQTTVRAYQTLIRESLDAQFQANLATMPQRHLPMTDPIIEAIVAWSNPARANA